MSRYVQVAIHAVPFPLDATTPTNITCSLISSCPLKNIKYNTYTFICVMICIIFNALPTFLLIEIEIVADILETRLLVLGIGNICFDINEIILFKSNRWLEFSLRCYKYYVMILYSDSYEECDFIWKLKQLNSARRWI